MPHHVTKGRARRPCKALVTALAVFCALGLMGEFETGASAIAASTSPVNVQLSNRSRGGASCKAAGVTHIYVTISDVQAHRSGKGGGGFVSLTPGSPQQFDLLFASSESGESFDINDCPIAALGGTGLPPGKYQQLRLITVANTSGGTPVIAPADNACSSLGDTVYNCVDTGSGLAPLTIPSGSQTGIKIPASQVSRGGFSVSTGQGLDLDVDVDACSSLVVHGPHGKIRDKHGKPSGTASYSFKPVLHSGEVSLQPIIAGTVFTGTTAGPSSPVTIGTTAVPGANVWLETEPPAANVPQAAPTPTGTTVSVNDVVAEATTDSDGNFSFCPVPTGTYDIVVDSPTVPSASNPSDATITTGVAVAASGGPNGLEIPILEGAAASTLNAQVTTTSTVPPGLGDDIDFLGTQGFGTGAASQAPVPLYTGSGSSPVTTALTSNGCISVCPTGTNCACFSLVMPSDNPVTGAGGSYTSGASGADYSLFGAATAIGTTTSVCAPSELVSAPHASPLPTPTLSFAGCD